MRARSSERGDVILYGYYGCGNLGDDLLMLIALDALRLLFPGQRILVCDHGDRRGFERIGADVVFTGVQSIPADQTRGKAKRTFAYLAAWARLLGESRWLVFGGGTVFHPGVRPLLLQTAICALARLRRARIAALGVGVADIDSAISRWLLRRIVAMSSVFLVRDAAALRQCRGTHARMTGDLVFSWRPLRDARVPRRDDTAPATIALTLSPEAFDAPALERSMVALADWVRLCRAAGHRVIFLELLRAGVTPGDEALFSRIAAHLRDVPPVELRQLTADPAAIAAAFRDIDLVCGTRYHALVLAAMLDRPFVGLTHENKIASICQSLGMPCLDARAVDAGALATVVTETLAKRPDAATVAALAADARRNFDALAAAIG